MVENESINVYYNNKGIKVVFMNIIDLIIVIIIISFMYTGYLRGFIMTLYGIANFVISWFFTIKFYPYVSNYIMENKYLLNFVSRLAGSFRGMLFNVATLRPFVNLISIIFTFVFFMILLRICAVLLNIVANYSFIKIFNRIGGGVLGIFEAVIILYIAFGLFKTISNIIPFQYWIYIDKSQFARIFLNSGYIYKIFLL